MLLPFSLPTGTSTYLGDSRTLVGPSGYNLKKCISILEKLNLSNIQILYSGFSLVRGLQSMFQGIRPFWWNLSHAHSWEWPLAASFTFQIPACVDFCVWQVELFQPCRPWLLRKRLGPASLLVCACQKNIVGKDGQVAPVLSKESFCSPCILRDICLPECDVHSFRMQPFLLLIVERHKLDKSPLRNAVLPGRNYNR